MSDTVTAALIAFGGVVIGYIFNMITDYIKNKHENQRIELSLKADEINSRKSISVQYITNKRVDWIYEVRNTLSDYIALAQECANKKVNNENVKIPETVYRELNAYLAKLRLLFNFDGDEDKKILDLLDKIKNNISENDNFCALNFQNDMMLLTKHSQVYLKLEWERVKYEIRGEKDPSDEELLKQELSNLKEKYYKKYLKHENGNQNG